MTRTRSCPDSSAEWPTSLGCSPCRLPSTTSLRWERLLIRSVSKKKHKNKCLLSHTSDRGLWVSKYRLSICDVLSSWCPCKRWTLPNFNEIFYSEYFFRNMCFWNMIFRLYCFFHCSLFSDELREHIHVFVCSFNTAPTYRCTARQAGGAHRLLCKSAAKPCSVFFFWRDHFTSRILAVVGYHLHPQIQRFVSTSLRPSSSHPAVNHELVVYGNEKWKMRNGKWEMRNFCPRKGARLEHTNAL